METLLETATFLLALPTVADARVTDAPRLRYTVRPWVRSGAPLPTHFLALAARGPSTPPTLASRENTPPDSGHGNSRARTHIPASLVFGSKHADSESRKSSPTPTRRPRGATVPVVPVPVPRTPERGTDRAESVVSFTTSVRGQQVAGWLAGLLGR